MASVVVYCEAGSTGIKKPSLEAVSAGAQHGDVIAVVYGKEDHKDILGKAGAKTIVHQDMPYSPVAHGHAVAEVAKKHNAQLVLLSASIHGKEVSAMCAGVLQAALFSDCISIESTSPVIVKHPVYAGKAICTAKSKADVTVLTLRPNVFAHKEQAGDGTVEAGNAQVQDLGTKLVQFVQKEQTKQELTEADIIVSGGRGLGGPEHFDIIEQLADALGGAVGASRAVVDEGWRPHEDQVGQTGKTVSPKLYIACAISGAVQHIAGMRTSKVIVAINKDKDAPIFKIADYGIVGDVFEVLPQLTEEIKKRKG